MSGGTGFQPVSGVLLKSGLLTRKSVERQADEIISVHQPKIRVMCQGWVSRKT